MANFTVFPAKAKANFSKNYPGNQPILALKHRLNDEDRRLTLNN